MKQDSTLLHQITALTRITRLKRNIFVPDSATIKSIDPEFTIDIDDVIEQSKEILTKITYINIAADSIQRLAEFSFEFEFKIEGLHNYLSPVSKNKYEIEAQLNLWLNNVVIATSRGIIFSELQGSPLAALILPLTNPQLLP
jgi:hypothetical protein